MMKGAEYSWCGRCVLHFGKAAVRTHPLNEEADTGGQPIDRAHAIALILLGMPRCCVDYWIPAPVAAEGPWSTRFARRPLPQPALRPTAVDLLCNPFQLVSIFKRQVRMPVDVLGGIERILYHYDLRECGSA